jgi:signal peptidase II
MNEVIPPAKPAQQRRSEPPKRARLGLVLLLAFTVYALDQATKWLVVNHIEYEAIHPVIHDFFSLVYFGNTGAAFSMFENGNTFFIVLSTVALVVLSVLFTRGVFASRWMSVALGLLAGGIGGNLTDRLIHAHVVDFLLFDLHVPFANPWPAFNVADSAICIATAIFVIQSFQNEAR